MKILFVSYDVPYPLDAGGKIRAFNLIKELSKRHQITLFSYYRDKLQLKHLSQLEKYCQKVRFFQRMPVFSLKHILTTLSHPSLTAHISHYYHKELKNELKKELKENRYDILHLESFFTSHLLNNLGEVPQILGTENIEWRVFFEHAKRQKIPVLREAMVLEALRTRWFEKRTWQKADLCLAVSEENKKEIEKATGRECCLIPNGVDLNYFEFTQQPATSDQKTILFVGNFKYIQNQDAVVVLAKQILPLIKKEIKNIRLLIVGRQPTKAIRTLAGSDIIVDSKIEDIREAYQQADLLLAPIRAGSGTKFKILEAMACGVPVVTTKLGIEGIKAKDEKEVLIREKPEKLAGASIRLMKDKDFRNKLTIKARKLVEEKYDWKKISQKLEKVYQKFIRGVERKFS